MKAVWCKRSWKKKVGAKGEEAYVASTHADVVDADDDIVRVFDFRYGPVFVLGLSGSV